MDLSSIMIKFSGSDKVSSATLFPYTNCKYRNDASSRAYFKQFFIFSNRQFFCKKFSIKKVFWRENIWVDNKIFP